MSRSTQNLDRHSPFRRPCFQCGEAWENAKFAVRPTFAPKSVSGMNGRESRVLSKCPPHICNLDTPCSRNVASKAQLKNSKHDMCLVGGQSFARKTTTQDEIFSLSLAADSGADANQKHNNQPNKHFHAHLSEASCVSAILGRLGDCGSLGVTSCSTG